MKPTTRTLTALFASLCALASSARAQDLEGILLGDQTPYWRTGGQVLYFPHVLHQYRNQAFVMMNSDLTSAGSLPLAATGGYYAEHSLEVLGGTYGGAYLGLGEDLTLGFWISQYAPDDFNDFIGDAFASTGYGGAWVIGADPYPLISAGRKYDLLLSYNLPGADLSFGLRLFYGGQGAGYTGDDSAGFIIITDDDGTQIQLDTDDASNFGVSQFGLSLGAGFGGIQDLVIDGGLHFDLTGASLTQYGETGFFDLGRTRLGLNGRGTLALDDQLEIGGYLAFFHAGYGFSPKREADDTVLDSWDNAFDNTLNSPTDTLLLGSYILPVPELGTAPAGDTYDGQEYGRSENNLELTVLAKLRPISRAELFGAVSLRYLNVNLTSSVDRDWSIEQSRHYFALPELRLGVRGKVASWLDVYISAVKGAWVLMASQTALDDRIPEDDLGQGGAAVPATSNNTNFNRRRQEVSASTSGSFTRLYLGWRMHYGCLYFMTQLDPAFLYSGPSFISGDTDVSSPFVRAVLGYDFSHDLVEASSTAAAVSPHQPAPQLPPAQPASPADKTREHAAKSFESLDSSEAASSGY